MVLVLVVSVATFGTEVTEETILVLALPPPLLNMDGCIGFFSGEDGAGCRIEC